MLKPQERQQQIIKDIDSLDDNIIPKLSQKYGVSEMTIRRDLKVLEETGLIKRTYGGAVRWPDPPLLVRDKRQTLAQSQKARIARYAAEHLVQHGDIIILEGGTTATAMAMYLADKDDLTVVTNGMATAEELRRNLPLSATIIATGGILRRSSTCVGPVTERFFREFHANRLFLSATGLTLQEGITDPKMLETQVKRAMIASAGEVIMPIDSTKFGIRSLMKVIDWSEIGMLITDDNAPEEMVAGLCAEGVEVMIAPTW